MPNLPSLQPLFQSAPQTYQDILSSKSYLRQGGTYLRSLINVDTSGAKKLALDQLAIKVKDEEQKNVLDETMGELKKLSVDNGQYHALYLVLESCYTLRSESSQSSSLVTPLFDMLPQLLILHSYLDFKHVFFTELQTFFKRLEAYDDTLRLEVQATKVETGQKQEESSSQQPAQELAQAQNSPASSVQPVDADKNADDASNQQTVTVQELPTPRDLPPSPLAPVEVKLPQEDPSQRIALQEAPQPQASPLYLQVVSLNEPKDLQNQQNKSESVAAPSLQPLSQSIYQAYQDIRGSKSYVHQASSFFGSYTRLDTSNLKKSALSQLASLEEKNPSEEPKKSFEAMMEQLKGHLGDKGYYDALYSILEQSYNLRKQIQSQAQGSLIQFVFDLVPHLALINLSLDHKHLLFACLKSFFQEMEVYRKTLQVVTPQALPEEKRESVVPAPHAEAKQAEGEPSKSLVNDPADSDTDSSADEFIREEAGAVSLERATPEASITDLSAPGVLIQNLESPEIFQGEELTPTEDDYIQAQAVAHNYATPPPQEAVSPPALTESKTSEVNSPVSKSTAHRSDSAASLQAALNESQTIPSLVPNSPDSSSSDQSQDAPASLQATLAESKTTLSPVAGSPVSNASAPSQDDTANSQATLAESKTIQSPVAGSPVSNASTPSQDATANSQAMLAESGVRAAPPVPDSPSSTHDETDEDEEAEDTSPAAAPEAKINGRANNFVLGLVGLTKQFSADNLRLNKEKRARAQGSEPYPPRTRPTLIKASSSPR